MTLDGGLSQSFSLVFDGHSVARADKSGVLATDWSVNISDARIHPHVVALLVGMLHMDR